jgi:hypothetical protein
VKFKPEDFEGPYGDNPHSLYFFTTAACDRAAAIANARLAEMLAEAPVVYSGPGLRNEQFWDTVQCDGYTHRARLVCIEDLKK